ncbi:MAG: Stp1/IreP family PP2C-type Ser/Thr phosphatase [Nitrospirales bacterium]|nr:Stp1/IreP family PP2C-type Ser/Thr phosphatase [Nitrospira sp.]MDR4502969.1 Stp1/IreP family PP2C-type Ser/Thr phosphatase [Nitrospirales bacterium]
MAITWQGWGLTDIGRVRTVNQDTFRLHPDLSVWVVADGMGGHAGGEVASRLAIETIGPYIALHQERLNTPNVESRKSLLKDSLVATNQAIRTHARQHPAFSSMGTTAVVLHISGSSSHDATIAHVGDSRAYRIQDQAIIQLTRDHSLVEERIDLGIITREEASTHPLRNVLTKGLGIESVVEPSAQTTSLLPMDKILLCSDGLTKMLTDDEILTIIRQNQHSMKEACQLLIDRANQLGGQDNITVVLVSSDH